MIIIARWQALKHLNGQSYDLSHFYAREERHSFRQKFKLTMVNGAPHKFYDDIYES